MKILLPLLLLLISQCLFSQGKYNSDTTRKVPFDTNRIKEQTRLSNSSDVFSYDSLYIWNDKRNLSEIMDERPGYFVFNFGLGQRNDINYNGRYSRETGIFRDGIQINDNFFQSFDIQNISVNEIDKIEEVSDVSSFFYGINSFSKSINVITKDIFQPKPFSQLRFSQDRFGALFADVLFSQPFSRKGNFQLGVTNQSGDGRYDNSAYNIWRGRGRINMFLSPTFNAKFNFYLDNYDRDLNDGLVYSANENNLTDPNNAVVVFPNTNENLENYFYDLTLTGSFFKNKNSLTKLKLYSNNSLRHLFDADTSAIRFNAYPSGYTHSVLYGLDATQNIFIPHGRDFYSDILIGGNVYLNSFAGNTFDSYTDNQYSLRLKYDLTYKRLFISGLLRNDYIYEKNYLNSGIEAKFSIYNKKDFGFDITGGVNQTKYLLFNSAWISRRNIKPVYDIYMKFYEIGGILRYKDLSVSGNLYEINYGGMYPTHYGVNSNISFISKYADATVSYNHSNELMFPQNYIKSDIAYKNVLFRGKLKLKTGFNIKYYNIKNITFQQQTWYGWDYSYIPFPQQNQFIADFYVGARIGRANINLTIANIFNSLVYNTYLFPLDDRGGFLNSISRFTIVWDFIN